AFDEPRYISAAVRATEFVLTNLRRPDGRLFRTTAVGSAPKLDAYLEDYAYLIESLTRLYEATFEAKWIDAAVGLADIMVRDFHDEANGGFFYTAIRHEPPTTRPKDSHDGSPPSGNSMAATALLRLSAFTGRHDLRDLGETTLQAFAGLMAEAPAAAGQMLIALDFDLGPTKEIAVIGKFGGEVVRRVLGAIRCRFPPNVIVAAHDPGSGPPPASIPLLHDRPALGDVTTYVCENFTCQQPLVGADASVRAVESL